MESEGLVTKIESGSAEFETLCQCVKGSCVKRRKLIKNAMSSLDNANAANDSILAGKREGDCDRE